MCVRERERERERERPLTGAYDALGCSQVGLRHVVLFVMWLVLAARHDYLVLSSPEMVDSLQVRAGTSSCVPAL